MTQTWPAAVLFDLLMAVMKSLDVWPAAAGDAERGARWRDAVTARMVRAGRYVPYDRLVAEAANELGLPPSAPDELRTGWAAMDPWPDSAAVSSLPVPYAFVTNCSAVLARIAAARSGLRPALVLSAEEAGWYKSHPEIYRLACLRLGSRAEDVLFVAGSPCDAEGASGAGLRAAFVRRRPDHATPRGAVASVSSLDEIVAQFPLEP